MYCTWESIDTDHGPRTTDDDDGHTLNLYYYMMSSAECCGDTNIRLYQLYLIETAG
jgi:hypothetical protein